MNELIPSKSFEPGGPLLKTFEHYGSYLLSALVITLFRVLYDQRFPSFIKFCPIISRAFRRVKKFFNCYLAAPRLTLGHSQGDSLTNPMLITAI